MRLTDLDFVMYIKYFFSILELYLQVTSIFVEQITNKQKNR